MTLSERDVSVVLMTLLDAAAADDEHGFATRVLDAVEQLVPSDVATFNVIDLRAGAADVVSRPFESLSPAQLERFAEHVREHPLIAHFAREPSDEHARAISDFLSRRAFHATGLHSEFFGELAIEDQLAVNLPVGHRAVVGIAVNRPRSTFSPREREALELLRPAVARALALVEDRRRMAATLQALERGLDASGTAVAAVTDGRLVHLSPKAADLLAGALPDSVAAALTAGLDPPAIAAHRGRRLSFSLLRGEVDLLLVRERPPPERGTELTARELAVLEHVRDGLADREIADLLGVSPRTVHRHLRNIYAKLGVRRRTAAVARVFGASG